MRQQQQPEPMANSTNINETKLDHKNVLDTTLKTSTPLASNLNRLLMKQSASFDNSLLIQHEVREREDIKPKFPNIKEGSLLIVHLLSEEKFKGFCKSYHGRQLTLRNGN